MPVESMLVFPPRKDSRGSPSYDTRRHFVVFSPCHNIHSGESQESRSISLCFLGECVCLLLTTSRLLLLLLLQLTAKQIACDTGGIYEHVEDGGDLSQAMAFFYRYVVAVCTSPVSSLPLNMYAPVLASFSTIVAVLFVL